MTTKKRFLAILSGYTEDNKLFFSFVRDGDERGTCIQEDEPGFLALVQEIAEVDLGARRWLEGYRPKPITLRCTDE